MLCYASCLSKVLIGSVPRHGQTREVLLHVGAGGLVVAYFWNAAYFWRIEYSDQLVEHVRQVHL